MRITNKKILLFISVGFCLALAVSIAISKRLSTVVAEEVELREVETMFSAIESGPLALARLQSADMAQEELNRLMSHPQVKNRSILSVSILGGDKFSCKFAEWFSSRVVESFCTKSMVRSFLPKDAINGFQVIIGIDQCYVSPEEKEIFFNSAFAGMLVAIIGMTLFGLSLWPVASSIRKAELVIGYGRNSLVEEIPFLPIKTLASKAMLAIELEREAAFASLAAQVSHDIRSPLSALNIVLSATPEIPEDKREIIASVSARINSIANLLLQKGKKVQSERLVTKSTSQQELHTDLYSSLNSILNEKKAQFGSRIDFQLSFSPSLSEHVAIIDPVEFGRVLSNLLNNAIEAIPKVGVITVSSSISRNSASIVIVDNGRGISSENLEKIGAKGFSLGKNGTDSGSGLGLFHAKQTILAAQGKFNIHSKVNEGTIVTIVLPCKKADPANL